MRKIVRGGGDKSFGIQVARLAGVPQAVLDRAKQILSDLEHADIAREHPQLVEKELLQSVPDDDPAERKVISQLREMDIDRLTPLEALNRLYSLRALLQ